MLTEVGSLEISLPSSHTRIVLNETATLYRYYIRSLIQVVRTRLRLSMLYARSIRLSLSEVNSMGVNGKRGSVYTALAEWNIDLFGNPPSPLTDLDHPSSNFRPVKLLCYTRTSISGRSGEDLSKFLVAVVSWCTPHPRKSAVGNPAQIWSKNLYVVDGIYTFLPLSNLKCCASYVTKIGTESVLVIIPLVE